MRRNADFLLQDVAGTRVIVPVGEAVTVFPGMITVNETGSFIWQLLETEQTAQTVAEALVARYEVTQEQAMADAEAFFEQLKPTGALLD